MFSTCLRTIPGPLSVMVTRYRPGLVAFGGAMISSILTSMSGRIDASSQASSALSTASLTVVRSAFRGLSNPRRCRFLAKNSETEMSLCFVAMDSAFACVLFVVFLAAIPPSLAVKTACMQAFWCYLRGG